MDAMAETWGVQVSAVEINEVKIPTSLQDAMSRQAQAEREKTARITIAESEIEASKRMVEAAKTYSSNPVSLKLRWMNQLYEMGLKGEGNVIIVPADMPIAGVASNLALGLLEKKKKENKTNTQKDSES